MLELNVTELVKITDKNNCTLKINIRENYTDIIIEHKGKASFWPISNEKTYDMKRIKVAITQTCLRLKEMEDIESGVFYASSAIRHNDK